MKKTGELLKKTREEKGLSLHEIGLSLKINSKILKAIEDGEKKDLPAKTFLRGFVQSYAHYLKLNPEEVLKLFASEMGTTKPQIQLESDLIEKSPYQPAIATPLHKISPKNKSEATASASTSKEEKTNSQKHLPTPENSKFKTFTVFLTLLILVALILFTKSVVDRYQKEAQTSNSVVETSVEKPVEPPAPVTVTTSEAPPAVETAPPAPTGSSTSNPTTPFVSSQSVGTSGTPHPPAAHTATTTPVTSSTAVPSSTAATPAKPPTVVATTQTPAVPVKPTNPPPSSPQPPTPTTATPVAKPALTAPAAATSKPAAITAVPPASSPANSTITPPAAGGKNIELIIEALDTVEIEYSTPGGRIEKATLNPEQVHTIKTKSGVKLNVNNGGAINLIVNGKDIGVPGVLGRPIKLAY